MSGNAIEAIYVLSPQQQGMLLESLHSENTGRHVEQKVFSVDNKLDVAAYEMAWQHVMERHPILRTAFVWKAQKEPLQIVLSNASLPIEQHDLCKLPDTEQQQTIKTYLKLDRQRGFDLSKAPLMRLAVFWVTDKSCVLVWSHHHIVMDGWSIPIVSGEVARFYTALYHKQSIQLEAVRPYRDYIAWLTEQDPSHAQHFWQTALKGFRQPTAFPVDQDSLPLSQQAHYGYQEVHLGADTSMLLLRLAIKHHVTINSIIQGVWALILSRYALKSEVLFGTTVSGRPAELSGVNSMVGLFINTLPFRVTVPVDQLIWPWLQILQTQHLELRQYEYCSTGQIHQWSELPGLLPLYESVLVFENYPVNDQAVPLPSVAQQGMPESEFIGAQTNYPLTIIVTTANELSICLVHDTHRLHRDSVIHILSHFQLLLEQLASYPDPSVAYLRSLIAEQQIPKMRALHCQLTHRSAEQLVAPQSPIEQRLMVIWRELLGIEQLSIHDNFLELGGHSLLATQLLSRVREAFQVPILLQQLFEAPTIHQLAKIIETILLNEIDQLTETEAQQLLES